MATRVILTSQPDVACAVCERRLLRGEHHEVFLAAGRRRVVCELCTPRAVNEGWMRETEQQLPSLPPTRPRRGRSLFERLRGGLVREEERTAEDAEHPRATPVAAYGPPRTGAVEAQPSPQSTGELSGEPSAEPSGEPSAEPHAEPPGADVEPELPAALEIFNVSVQPRRIAGVARSLGEPSVNVRCAEHARSVVRIVVAWELCWYRYEVDLDELDAEARQIAQGTELHELDEPERFANAAADESGRLSLA